MQIQKTYKLVTPFPYIGKIQDYAQLIKLRLSFVVVFSAIMGYYLGTYGQSSWAILGWLFLGGFLVTGASNAINQILEKDTDKLMSRTSSRPLPAGRMSMAEAIISAGIMSIAGISILWFALNQLCGFLGTIALLSYAFLYTPLKKISSISVFVGAIPGALPPLIGWVAATGSIGLVGVLLFSIQFIWQFPHFWAIAWVLDDDYKKAGFRMLPSRGGKDKFSAFQTLAYSAMLIPIGLLPYFLGFTGWISAVIVVLAGLMLVWPSARLYIFVDNKSASKLMFSSFIYLPIVLLALVLDKI